MIRTIINIPPNILGSIDQGNASDYIFVIRYALKTNIFTFVIRMVVTGKCAQRIVQNTEPLFATT